MVVDLPPRWRWVGAVVAASAVLGVLWLVGVTRVDEPPRAPARQLLRAASSLTAVGEVTGALPSQASAPASRVAGAVEVCGLGWVKKPDDEADALALMTQSGVAQARQRILAKLRADPSEFSRATVLLLDMTSDINPGLLARIGFVADDGAQARNQLARLAASSTDAKVYALAYKACSHSASAGACQLINAEQWARLDPENAAPWVFMLSTASDRQDRAAQDEALHRIAVARYERLGFFAAAGTILDMAPDDDGMQLATWSLVTQVIGFEAAVGLPGLPLLVNACKGAALADANRAQTCGAIAEVMTERSDSLIDRMIGTSIGKNVGWPAERHERLRGEYLAFSTAMLPAEPDAEELGCARLRREMAHVRRHAAGGENAALREWVERSGKTPDDFLREERARQQRAERAKQEIAASAAAASAAR